MRDAFFRTLTELGIADPRIMFLTADLGFKLFDAFAEACPDRFLNLGVAEANMVSVAAGLALTGKRPFTYSITPFATIRCLEQIRNDVCNMELPVIVTSVGAGFAYGVNGGTHHGIDDVAAMRAMPGMTVVSPCDPRETVQAMQALLELGRPSYLRLGRAREPILANTDQPFELGVPSILQEGEGVALLACGSVVGEALEAAATLERESLVKPLVLSVHTLAPITGLAAILEQRHVRFAITVEEHIARGGLFEATCSTLMAAGSAIRVKGLHAPDRFIHTCHSQNAMRKKLGLDAAGIAAATLTTTCGGL